MLKLFARIAGYFSNRNLVGVDKAGNRYFTRKDEIDGIMKEKRWVVFRGEEDSTCIPVVDIEILAKLRIKQSPVEWICWLNGQRKIAPTPEEIMELEARRERVRQNVARLKKEEEEKRAKEGNACKTSISGKVGGPDLKSFIRQFPDASEGGKVKEASDAMDGTRNSKERVTEKAETEPESSEPTGSGASFKPGTWQPPS
ncbi:uncharacterized protein LOC121235249 isoform X1 [Juglans microcarpa x Juglans regia]|uniref:uncharacterized protein LOC121235249 isoform X1 n=1 Tax=Juglans microcarpa x Juglans regia TaxID=2249226 RepID=UPI001B7F5A77|nr:uncharacterized protein LOC121235249 isoform X1 [Juglans microcarpa x Juglans regia]